MHSAFLLADIAKSAFLLVDNIAHNALLLADITNFNFLGWQHVHEFSLAGNMYTLNFHWLRLCTASLIGYFIDCRNRERLYLKVDPVKWC